MLGAEVITEVNETGKKLETKIIAAGKEIAVQKIIYNESGSFVDEEVEWKNLDSFGLSDLRTRKKGQSAQVTGITFAPMELDMTGIELQSRVTTTSGGGATIDPEIPTLDPDSHEIGGLTNSNPGSYGAGGGGIVPLCVVYDSIVVECSRMRFTDGNGSSSLGGLVRAIGQSNQQVGTRVTGVRWGTPFSATYGNDGTRTIKWGEYNPALAHLYYGKESPIYDNNWSVIAFSQSQTQQNDPGVWDILKKAFQQVSCDSRLSRIFGGADAYMSTLVEPDLVNPNSTRRNPRIRDGGNSEDPRAGDAHLFANRDGLGVNEINAYTPRGYSYTNAYKGDNTGEFQNARRFFYNPSSLSKLGYKGGLVINFTHIGPTDRAGNHILPTGIAPNSRGSGPVGTLGGFDALKSVGGTSEGGTYVHSHLIFVMWNGSFGKDGKPAWNPGKRVDPRTVFCSDLGF